MTDPDIERLFAYITDLWPRWTHTGAQAVLLTDKMKNLDYHCVKRAAEQVFDGQTRRTVDAPTQEILRLARTYMPKQKVEDTGKDLHRMEYQLECIEHPTEFKPGTVVKFWARKQDQAENPIALRQKAERKAQDVMDAWGGTWVVMVDEDGNLIQGQDEQGGDKRGIPALRDAEAIIAAGPDSAGRRFLEKTYAAKEKSHRAAVAANMGADYQAEDPAIKKARITAQLSGAKP